MQISCQLLQFPNQSVIQDYIKGQCEDQINKQYKKVIETTAEVFANQFVAAGAVTLKVIKIIKGFDDLSQREIEPLMKGLSELLLESAKLASHQKQQVLK